MAEHRLPHVDHDAPDHDRAYCATCDNRSADPAQPFRFPEFARRLLRISHTERVVADLEALVTSEKAEAWAEGAEATADWIGRNPSAAGIPADPPLNPYGDPS